MGLVEAWGGNPVGWIAAHLIEGFYNLVYALAHTQSWLDWLSWENTTEDKESLMRFIYFGASKEFLFVFIDLFIVITIAGILYRPLMWSIVRGLETFANTIGRTAAWAGLTMVLLQILIIFLQRVFAVSQISFGFGFSFAFDVSWWSESLKFYNAIIVALCATYTFVQGSHVRVDLIYSGVSYRTKKAIDMFGSIVFMLPAAFIVWLYGWFFMWRHLIVPNPSASNSLDQLVMKARALRWNVETIGFSPNGFNAYFLFKMLLLAYTG
ncbi:MAG: TRAP transporter small permease subunit, partial [Rhodobacteraceae bacterium]|nr:TRAP transporter small permease subunit [Paracoccaceae bacterium]